ncbi:MULTISPECIES: hypothetical protein [Bacillus amyloliquefaciens group]|jgi:hypothetical protein|uniref:Uncharacterized protein n=1 Tax=Bacillus amyloliquefaciens (strain ATCC 23350 / DSM 7 / BCRC 11601 / CCUG 28519 / NBRC 15535 / NRRL B-14393 / F) TaxID=692420 RepID=A0A9P1JFW1_BACAS|nr:MULTISPECIES: hypothetical protein [Bacillus amyloliquefaciens group]MEC1838098.1 hypothetical protein [Bacillus amyloliquefaciens]MEC2050613.1 hypothetical protein [Bacillus amyloliquefaciens]GLW41271.1 hypothetical protein Bamy01_09160 [Bacillus amyloliquefaciens]CBI42057.1 hypothetical protein predicted by Glimmer/Critica [Bacillus amyloliquefaciens DSM 7] [Bacillus amyloliquefaciens DSM 7 = ATCC 23350]
MKRINTTEILLIVVLVSWIASMNFAKLSALDYIGIGSAIVFFVLLLLRRKGGVENDA